MATYFISDIHGEYALFRELLEKINFSPSDTMLVLGDFIDKGSSSIKLARLLSSAKNIRAVCGNHEHYFILYYQYLMRNFSEGGDINDVLIKLKHYFEGETENMTWEIVNYIEALPLYIESDDYICVHAGVELNSDGEIIPMKNQMPNSFIFDRKLSNENVVPKNSKTVIFGHTPCHYANGTGQIIKTPRHGNEITSSQIKDFAKIQLDGGTSQIGLLGTLRLEDMREFYVKKRKEAQYL